MMFLANSGMAGRTELYSVLGTYYGRGVDCFLVLHLYLDLWILPASHSYRYHSLGLYDDNLLVMEHQFTYSHRVHAFINRLDNVTFRAFLPPL